MDFIDIGLFASYALIGFCALFAIGIPLVQSFGDPKSLLKSGLGVLGIVVIFLVSYGLADDTGDTTAATAKLVGAGLITTYFCFFAAIIGIVYTEISKIVS